MTTVRHYALIALACAPLCAQYYGGSSGGGDLPTAAADPTTCARGIGSQYYNTVESVIRTCVNTNPATWRTLAGVAPPAVTGPELLHAFGDEGPGLYRWQVWGDFNGGTKAYTDVTTADPLQYTGTAAGGTGTIRESWLLNPATANTWYRLTYTIADVVSAGISGPPTCSLSAFAKTVGGFFPTVPANAGQHLMYFESAADAIGNTAGGHGFDLNCFGATGAALKISALSLRAVSGPPIARFEICGDPATANGPLAYDATRECFTSSPNTLNFGSGPTIQTWNVLNFATVPAPSPGQAVVGVDSITKNIKVLDEDGVAHSLENTDGVPEGTTNLYYTDARARAALLFASPLSWDGATHTLSCPTCGGTGTNVAYYQPNNPGTGGTTSPGGANGSRWFGFITGPASITFGRMLVYIKTADVSNLYDWGIYDTGGNLVAHVGPNSPPTGNASLDLPIAGGGTATLAAGTRYYFVFTGNAATAQIAYNNSVNSLQFCNNAAGPGTSDGTLPATATPPADSWTLAGYYPHFGLR